MESILSDKEVWSGETRVTGQKGHNFWADYWIALKLLQDFTEAVFHEVVMESILGDG
jgi:hypothetical protein